MASSTSSNANKPATGTKTPAVDVAETADVEVSDSGVEVRTTEGGAEAFTPVDLYNRAGEKRTAATLAERYALEFDGFGLTEKPKPAKSSDK